MNFALLLVYLGVGVKKHSTVILFVENSPFLGSGSCQQLSPLEQCPAEVRESYRDSGLLVHACDPSTPEAEAGDHI